MMQFWRMLLNGSPTQPGAPAPPPRWKTRVHPCASSLPRDKGRAQVRLAASGGAVRWVQCWLWRDKSRLRVPAMHREGGGDGEERDRDTSGDDDSYLASSREGVILHNEKQAIEKGIESVHEANISNAVQLPHIPGSCAIKTEMSEDMGPEEGDDSESSSGSEDGCTPHMISLSKSNQDMIKFLLKKEKNVNVIKNN